MGHERPRIGITMRIDSNSDRFYLGRHYSEAVEAAGGIPIHICLIPREDFLDPLLETLHGVLLPGSDSDVDPLRYGQEPHQQLGAVQPLKDDTDLIVLDAIERRNMPLLAICFGMQILNVARGGTLIQDIPSQLPNAVKHEQGAPRDRRSHGIRLLEDSRLSNLFDGHHAVVNSHHHQGIENVGRDLMATAWSSDGLVEGLEDSRPDRHVLAVQWHPEMGWRDDAFSQMIFSTFVESATGFQNNQLLAESSSNLETHLRV